MVQRKVSNKLGVHASNLLQTQQKQTKTNPCPQTHDGRIKAPDLKTKKMKKSRSIKRADLDYSLGSSSSPITRKPPWLPGKPPPPSSPTKTPSPKKASQTYGSPNYMKSTSSSEARKEQSKVSSSSSLKLHRVPKTLSRTSSLKKVRNLTKSPSFKHTRKVVLQRDTCSSTMKDSKFPPYLELSHGATEAEGTSVMKVCPYNYCSLNGHHHKPRPSLRCFLSSRRKQMKTQKVVKPEDISSHTAKEDFFIEICVPEREVMEIWSERPCSENGDTVSSGPQKTAQDQTWGCDRGEVMDYPASVSLDDLFSEASEMEWEGQGKISVKINDEYDLEDFIDEKSKACFDEDITEIESISDADSVPDSESTQPGDDEIGYLLQVEEEGITNCGNIEDVSTTPDFHSIEEQDDFSSQHSDEITMARNEDPDFYQESGDINVDEATEDKYTREDIEEQEDETDNIIDEKISSEDMIKDALPEIETSTSSDASEVEVNQIEPDPSNSGDENENPVAEIEEPEEKDDPRQIKGNKFIHGVADSSHEILDGCIKLRKSIRCKKEEEESEEGKEFNPRGPNFLPIKPDPDGEKVDLRHQEMDERRNAEEWMLDYALQKTVNQLALARRRKVALLVEAFESVIPTPRYESRLKRNSSGFANAKTNARLIQACS